MSIAIRKLEEEFGASLFDRSKRYEYRLTQVGEALYSYATRMLHLRNEASAALGDICKLRAGRLRIGANESISLYLLPLLAEAFLKQHSKVRTEVKCERSESVLVELKERKLQDENYSEQRSGHTVACSDLVFSRKDGLTMLSLYG